MNYQHLWTTPIVQVQINLDEDLRRSLVQCVVQNYIQRMDAQEPVPSFIDLFDYTQYAHQDKLEIFKAVHRFELIISKILRTYAKQAWGVSSDTPISMHCTSKIHQPFEMRVEPHRHNNADICIIHYLTAGGEFHLDNHNPPEPLNNDYSGDLLILDPRPNITYPYNEKAKTFRPQTGTTIVHPGYVWHETHQHTKDGLRICLIVNAEIDRESKVHPSLQQLIKLRPVSLV